MENEQMAMEMQEKQEEPKQKAEIVEMANMDETKLTANMDGSVFTNLATFKDAFLIGKYFSQSSLVPQSYQGKPMDCAIAVDMANRMGVSPMFVMQNLWVVRGIPSWSGQACMGIIRACGRYTDVKPVYTGERDKDTWGCYVSAKDVKSGEIIKGTEVTIGMAKKEGWYSKSGSKWQTMPELMLAYRAAAFFARVYAPNELMGYKIEGEAEDMTGTKETVKAINPFAEDKA